MVNLLQGERASNETKTNQSYMHIANQLQTETINIIKKGYTMEVSSVPGI